VAIITILAGSAVSIYSMVIRKEMDKEAWAALEAMRDAETRYYVHSQTYATDEGTILYLPSLPTQSNINTVLDISIPESKVWEYCIQGFADPNAPSTALTSRVRLRARVQGGGRMFGFDLVNGDPNPTQGKTPWASTDWCFYSMCAIIY
jgi:Tfp pilus assembly protein PilE